MKKVSIVGFGRFGPVLYRLLKDDFIVTIYQRNKITSNPNFNKNTIITKNLEEVYKSDTIFYAVPIESFERVISSHKKYFKDNHLLIDVLSVKMHPAKIFTKYLRETKTQAILTHPMFGPDSSKEGFEGLPLIMDKFKSDSKNYNFWKNFFKNKKLRVVEMSAKEHDKIAASSQGLTHFTGRLLKAFGQKPTSIDSLGAKKLLEVQEQTCNDTMQLFRNLQHYNPFTKTVRIKLGHAYDKLYNGLLPKHITPGYITFGIQGGHGSFNEQAIRHYIQKENIKRFKIRYLYTSANVMKELHSGKIDQGLFAIHNSIGGMVEESIQAIAKYKFRIIEEFAIKISHALMIRKDARISDITTIMTHPQVLAQCKKTLNEKFPELKQTSGKGKFIDHAWVAKNLGEKKLPKNIAVMGSSILADLYNLTIVENNLQDLKENYTSFLLVTRI